LKSESLRVKYQMFRHDPIFCDASKRLAAHDEAVIVSEEMGGISICHRRRIERNFTPETFRQRIVEILLHSNHEETELEKLARELALLPVHQTDPGKLAREVDVRPARDNGLVPDQKERSDDALAV
jgi:hypothetical protein